MIIPSIWENKPSTSFEHRLRSTMPSRASEMGHVPKMLKFTQICTKFLKVAPNCARFHKIAQKWSKCLRMSLTVSWCMGQQVSKGVMCLHIQVRKLFWLDIAVAGVYRCTALRSVSIELRPCLAAIASSNGFIPKKDQPCSDRTKCPCPQFLLLH